MESSDIVMRTEPLDKALIEVLTKLPSLDTVDQRRAMLIILGFPDVGIYLDFAGTYDYFVTNLVRALGRFGKRVTVSFLSALSRELESEGVDAPQLVDIKTQALSDTDAAWLARMVPSRATSISMSPDRSLLAISVVVLALAPLRWYGSNMLRRLAGDAAADLALRIDRLSGSRLRVTKGVMEQIEALEADADLEHDLLTLMGSVLIHPSESGWNALAAQRVI